jgi:hypothetical protein
MLVDGLIISFFLNFHRWASPNKEATTFRPCHSLSASSVSLKPEFAELDNPAGLRLAAMPALT